MIRNINRWMPATWNDRNQLCEKFVWGVLKYTWNNWVGAVHHQGAIKTSPFGELHTVFWRLYYIKFSAAGFRWLFVHLENSVVSVAIRHPLETHSAFGRLIRGRVPDLSANWNHNVDVETVYCAAHVIGLLINQEGSLKGKHWWCILQLCSFWGALVQSQSHLWEKRPDLYK